MNMKSEYTTAVLDHGYLKLIESWGSDKRIIEAARMSTNKGFLGWGPKHHKDCLRPDLTFSECTCNSPQPGDEKLLKYLWTHKHHTPFEMCGLTIEVQAPIFVFREWHRHRTQSYNEMSARYIPLPNVNYLPTIDRCKLNSDSNRQAASVEGKEFSTDKAANWLYYLNELYRRCQLLYKEGLEIGLPKELARIILPVGRYSRMRASANLRNWLAFLTLRMAPNAQWEIRQYANALGTIISEIFPRTWELFAKDLEG